MYNVHTRRGWPCGTMGTGAMTPKIWEILGNILHFSHFMSVKGFISVEIGQKVGLPLPQKNPGYVYVVVNIQTFIHTCVYIPLYREVKQARANPGGGEFRGSGQLLLSICEILGTFP